MLGLLIEGGRHGIQISHRKHQEGKKSFLSLWKHRCLSGFLNPLSTRSIIEFCVMSVLISSCKNWILSENCLDQLELIPWGARKMGSKMAKALSNTAAISALEVESIRCWLVVRKLG